jgi:dipeptide/tripeptide permease
MARALSILAAFTSPVFLCAAIAGWLYDIWPANPLTFGAAALFVAGGPILGIVHVAMARHAADDDEVEADEPVVALAAPAVVRHPAPVVHTAKSEAARRFANWREAPNDAITRRERERRANQYVRG